MKRIYISLAILMIFGVGLGFASCIPVNSADFNNISINITGQCYTFVDSVTGNTFTVSAPTPQYSTVITVNPLQSKTDLTTNVTCVGNSVYQNAQIGIDNGTSITDSVSNNTYTCLNPSTPFENQTIQANQSFSDRNITVSCSQSNLVMTPSLNTNVTDPISGDICISPKLTLTNTTQNITYNQCVVDTNSNTTYCGPPIPDVQSTTSLICGQNLTTIYNETIDTVPTDCNQNIPPQQVGVDGTYTNANCGLTVIGPTSASLNLNQVLTVAPGQQNVSSKYGIICEGVNGINSEIPANLMTTPIYLTSANPNYYDSSNGDNVSCVYGNSTYQTNETNFNVTGLEAINANDTSCVAAPVCVDKLQAICQTAATETGNQNNLASGDIYSCINEIQTYSSNQVISANNQTATANDLVNQWRNPMLVLQSILGSGIDIVALVLLVILVMLCIVVYVLAHHRNQNFKTKYNPPKAFPRKPVPKQITRQVIDVPDEDIEHTENMEEGVGQNE